MKGLLQSRPRIRWPVAGLVLAGWLVITCNLSFWRSLVGVLAPLDAADGLLLAGVAVMLLALFWLLLALLAWRRVAAPAWAAVLVLAAAGAYFMDSYGIVIDKYAMQAVFETDPREASEWLSRGMLPYALLGLAPVAWLGWIELTFRPGLRGWADRAGVVMLAVAVIAAGVLVGFRPLSSVARNERGLQHQINPTTVLQSIYGQLRRRIAPYRREREAILTDAHAGASWSASDRPRLLVLVVGESARAQSFGLQGYARDTTPELAAQPESVVHWDEVRSCGTSTAVSLPCMFSGLGHDRYGHRDGRQRESLLDGLAHAGVASLWLDNNTGSKGVAERTGEELLADDRDARWCGGDGCYDELLVERLERMIRTGTVPPLVVLHQKGSHGPSYYARYPAAFRRFVPTCDSNQLERCSREAILNAYDNSILYTDHVLARTIEVLRAAAAEVDTAMLYVSDHGESTGERGIYLHGAPEFMAPDEQTRVPMLWWMSNGFERRFELDRNCLMSAAHAPVSHDALFHALLGLLDVSTRDYQPSLDPFAACRHAPGAHGTGAHTRA